MSDKFKKFLHTTEKNADNLADKARELRDDVKDFANGKRDPELTAPKQQKTTAELEIELEGLARDNAELEKRKNLKQKIEAAIELRKQLLDDLEEEEVDLSGDEVNPAVDSTLVVTPAVDQTTVEYNLAGSSYALEIAPESDNPAITIGDKNFDKDEGFAAAVIANCVMDDNCADEATVMFSGDFTSYCCTFA